VFWALARRLGPTATEDRAGRGGDTLVLVSIKWLIERVFGITTFSLFGM